MSDDFHPPEVLATVGKFDYITGVLKRPRDASGPSTFYCSIEDWEASDAFYVSTMQRQLADMFRDRRAAELKVGELIQRNQAQERTIARLQHQLLEAQALNHPPDAARADVLPATEPSKRKYTRRSLAPPTEEQVAERDMGEGAAEELAATEEPAEERARAVVAEALPVPPEAAEAPPPEAAEAPPPEAAEAPAPPPFGGIPAPEVPSDALPQIVLPRHQKQPCGVDGCLTPMALGAAMATHRQRRHPAWHAAQMAIGHHADVRGRALIDIPEPSVPVKLEPTQVAPTPRAAPPLMPDAPATPDAVREANRAALDRQLGSLVEQPFTCSACGKSGNELAHAQSVTDKTRCALCVASGTFADDAVVAVR